MHPKFEGALGDLLRDISALVKWKDTGPTGVRSHPSLCSEHCLLDELFLLLKYDELEPFSSQQSA